MQVEMVTRLQDQIMERINKDLHMSLPRVGRLIDDYDFFQKKYELKRQSDKEFQLNSENKDN